MSLWKAVAVVPLAAAWFGLAGALRGADVPVAISYGRDIRPVLSENCFTCHGQDSHARKGKLRLDTQDGQRAKVVRPGHPETSELVKRIFTRDADDLMPPPTSHHVLDQRQKLLLQRWIAVGAPFAAHWAYTAPVRPPEPTVSTTRWVRNPIDRFVLAKLEAAGLSPAPEADPATLIRRLCLDLTGLPPTPAEIDAFLADTSPDAYARVVDRLLASPHYGERMVLPWLDASRYADSNGFQQDGDTCQWVWRDWVVQALNQNMPFDRFTILQLAGDLLPDATPDDRLATAFVRNGMLNGEGGAIPEEQRYVLLFDRVNTTATTWLGLTMACAQCHDHKYDPITRRDYYSWLAAFNNVPEDGLAGHIDASLRPAEPLLDMARPDHPGEIRKVMVMSDTRPRETHILERGNYLAPQDKVEVDVPAFLPPLAKDAPRNRLGLARWLVSPQNPLTARVQVNRMWQTIFGIGLVKTSEDFGVQGDIPEELELLDWLAVDLREHGWEMKRLNRLIVTSATYRQSSRVTAMQLQCDPENRLMAHAPRYRLSSLIIRDQALAASGLLVDQIGGKPVYPYQPAGIWDSLAITNERDFSYPQSHGEALHRRSLYTFWRRTVAPADFFDTSARNICTVRRAITSTPLHALTTLDDPTYIEAARMLAQRVMSAPADKRLPLAFRYVLSRWPDTSERSLLMHSYERELEHLRAQPKEATDLLSCGETPRDPGLDPAQLAATAIVCLGIFNLDEALCRQ